MSAQRGWLPVVLRARQAQEDQVAQRVALARRDVQVALDQHAAHADRVAAMPVAFSQSAAAFQASEHTRNSAAATLAAAGHRVTFAQTRVDTGVRDLTDAARSRRSVEKLHERDVELRAADELARAQKESDEVAISRHQRVAR